MRNKLLEKLEKSVLNVVFYTGECSNDILKTAKNTNWEVDLKDGKKSLLDYFFTSKGFLCKNRKAEVLISDNQFGKGFTNNDIKLLIKSGIKVIIAERFCLQFLKDMREIDIVLITLFRDDLKIMLPRLISRRKSGDNDKLDNDFKIRLSFDKEDDTDMKIFIKNDFCLKMEIYSIGGYKRTFLDKIL